ASAITKGAYVALNPVAGGYVEEPGAWPSINLLPSAEVQTIERPSELSSRSRLPQKLPLQFASPDKPGFERHGERLAQAIGLACDAARRYPRNRRAFV